LNRPVHQALSNGMTGPVGWIHGIPDIIQLACKREGNFRALEIIHRPIDIVADIGGFSAGWIGGWFWFWFWLGLGLGLGLGILRTALFCLLVQLFRTFF
jgi:hypothetical protein